MKPLILSPKEREQLVEMCNVLFPDYNISLYDECLDDLTDGLIRLVQYQPHYNSMTIHWVEFCITHLPITFYRWLIHERNMSPIKAFEIISKNLSQWEDFDRYPISPINFLYDNFKNFV